jgi:O-antigen/teichoic acid export membrane protein
LAMTEYVNEMNVKKRFTKNLPMYKHTIKLYKHFMDDSFYRNSIYLLLNMGIGALTGFIFWIIAAHLYSTTNVGKATALMAVISLISSLASLGLAKTVIRFLAKSKNVSEDIITKVLLTIISAIVFSIVIEFFLPYFKISHISIYIIILIIISGVISVIKSLFDNVFIAFRASGHALIENTVANISKLIIIFFVISLGYIGIFISQIAGILLAIIASIYLLVTRHKINFKVRPSLLTMSGYWTFSFGSYFNDLIGYLPTTLIPILVIYKIGPSNTALWYISMQVATVLFLVSNSINQSFLAESSHREKDLLNNAVRATKTMFLVLIPITILVVIFAPGILNTFGSEYRHASEVLRILAVSSLLVVVSYITGTILTIFRKIWFLAFTNFINAVVVIAGCLIFGNTLTKFGVIYLVGEVFNVLLFGAGAVYVLNKNNMLFANKVDGRVN